MTTNTRRLPWITTNWPLVRAGAAMLLVAVMLWTFRCSGWSPLIGLYLLMVATGCQITWIGIRKLLAPGEMSVESRQFEANVVLLSVTYTVCITLLLFYSGTKHS